MINLEQLSTQNIFQRLACTETGSIQKISLKTFFLENAKKFFGGTNYTDQRLVAFYTIKLLQNIESDALHQQLDKAVQLAKNANLLPQTLPSKLNTTNDLTKKIASHILPKHQLPGPVSFNELSYLYGRKLESLNLLEQSKAPNTENVFTIKQASWNWARIAVVSLIALASIPAGIATYRALNPDPINSLPMDPLHDMPEGLHDFLNTECIKNVGNIELQNPTETLQDIAKIWKSSVSIKKEPFPVCEITVKHKDCESIQERYSDKTSDHYNGGYYGELFRKLTANEAAEPMIQWLHRQFPNNSPWIQKGELRFKTSVDCILPENELYSDGSKWV